MKKIVLLLVSVCVVLVVKAQQCETFVPWQVGKKFTTENYDQKDKLSGSSSSEVISVNDVDGSTEIIIEVESFDKKGTSTGKNQYTYFCKGDVFEFDMKSFLNQDQMSGYESMQIEYQMENLAYPKLMTAGMKLKDGFVEAVVSNEGIKMVTIRADIQNVVVEAIEDITVPAGTFKAYKISSDIVSKVGFITVNMKSIQWMVKEVGAVRSESYNKNGKLMGYSVVSKIE